MGIQGPQGIQGPLGPTGPQGVQGTVGPQGPTGATGPASEAMIFETVKLGDVNIRIAPNEGGGNNQALGALVFGGSANRTVSALSAYIVQTGSITGTFQMAIARTISPSSAVIVATTNVVTSINAGLFVLPLTAPATLLANTTYYLIVYNQFNGSFIGGRSTGTGTSGAAPPINFRVQNISGFSVGQNVNTSDVNLQISPWLAALN